MVEDDDALLTLGKKMLENLGYTVLTAGSPGDAMLLAGGSTGGIDLLITDVVMPEMNGRDLANQLHALYRKLPVLFMSGYTANVVFQQDIVTEKINFMPKPFSRETLANKIREIFDNPQG